MKNTIIRLAGTRRWLGALLALPMLALLPACEEVNDGNGAFDDFIEVRDADGNIVTELTFPETGAAETLCMTAKGKGWLVVREAASPGGDWVSVSPQVAKAGSTTATVAVTPNTTCPSARTATYLFMCGELQHRIFVSQPAAPVVTTGEAIDVEFDRALLSGTWDYRGEERITAAEYGFRYRPYGREEWMPVDARPTVPVGEEHSEVYFEAAVEDLDRGGIYEYKAWVLSPERGEIEGEVRILRLESEPESLSVAALRALYAGATFAPESPIMLDCVVVSDAAAGNVPDGCLFVVDAGHPTEPGNGLMVIPQEPVSLDAGTRVEMLLREAAVGIFDDYPALLAVEYPERITPAGSQPVVPVTVSDPASLPDYESMLVSIPQTQLLSLYFSAANWGAASPAMLEVDGAATSYVVSVRSEAVFAEMPIRRGSGTMTGIVASESGRTNYVLMPRRAEDVALSEDESTRFSSQLQLRFTDVAFSGELHAGMESTAVLTVGYENAMGEEIAGTDIVVEATGVSGFAVAPAESYHCGTGAGRIEIPIVGTAQQAGTVRFRVTRIGTYSLPSEASVSVEVAALETADFAVVWNAPTSDMSSNKLPVGVVSPVLNVASGDDAAAVSAIGGNVDWKAGSGKFSSALGGMIDPSNTKEAPKTYMQCELTVKAVELSLSSFSCSLRFGAGGGGVTVSMMYSIDGGPLGDIVDFAPLTANANPIPESKEPVDLSHVEALQHLPAGTKVKLMIVPHGATDEKSTLAILATQQPTLTGTALK